MTYAAIAVVSWLAAGAWAAPPAADHLCFNRSAWLGDALSAGLDAMKPAELADFTAAGFEKAADARGNLRWRLKSPPAFVQMATSGPNAAKIREAVKAACGRLRVRLKPEVDAVNAKFQKAFKAKLEDTAAALPPTYLKEKGKWGKLIEGPDLDEKEVNEIAGTWKAIDGYVESYLFRFHREGKDFAAALKEYCSIPAPRYPSGERCLGLASAWSDAAERARQDAALAELTKLVGDSRAKETPPPSRREERAPASRPAVEAPILTPGCRAAVRALFPNFQKNCETDAAYAANTTRCEHWIAATPSGCSNR